MAWNEDIDWSDEDSMVNMPNGLPLSDLYRAMNERLSTLGIAQPLSGDIDINQPLDLMRDDLVSAVNGVVVSFHFPPNPPILIERWGFIRKTSFGDYDYADETAIDYWDMDKMETELGPEPDYYDMGAPITAAWLIWWHDALNLLTHVSYPFEKPFANANFQYSERSTAGLISSTNYQDTVDVWENTATWDAWAEGTVLPMHMSSLAYPFDTFLIRRVRYRMDPANRFIPYDYTNNYTLMAVLGFFPAAGNNYYYENNDYSAVLEGTFGEVYSDTSIQNGQYDTDIDIGDFGTVTVDAPPDEFGTTTQGWSAVDIRQITQFDVDGGFSFVAEE